MKLDLLALLVPLVTAVAVPAVSLYQTFPDGTSGYGNWVDDGTNIYVWGNWTIPFPKDPSFGAQFHYWSACAQYGTCYGHKQVMWVNDPNMSKRSVELDKRGFPCRVQSGWPHY